MRDIREIYVPQKFVCIRYVNVRSVEVIVHLHRYVHSTYIVYLLVICMYVSIGYLKFVSVWNIHIHKYSHTVLHIVVHYMYVCMYVLQSTVCMYVCMYVLQSTVCMYCSPLYVCTTVHCMYVCITVHCMYVLQSTVCIITVHCMYVLQSTVRMYMCVCITVHCMYVYYSPLYVCILQSTVCMYCSPLYVRMYIAFHCTYVRMYVQQAKISPPYSYCHQMFSTSGLITMYMYIRMYTTTANNI